MPSCNTDPCATYLETNATLQQISRASTNSGQIHHNRIQTHPHELKPWHGMAPSPPQQTTAWPR
eukprot:6539200-Lingulodinium_polyedra.AAC.1